MHGLKGKPSNRGRKPNRVAKNVRLTPDEWSLCKEIGLGNQTEGIAKLIKMAKEMKIQEIHGK